MSKAYYSCKYLDWVAVKNIMCYNTQNIENLTRQQIITRLFRATLRANFQHKVEGQFASIDDYNFNILNYTRDFQKLKTFKQASLEWNQMIEKYEQLQEDLFDPFMSCNESRPYSSTSSRYYIYSDTELQYDPFGYYKPRLLTDSAFEENMPVYRDLPLVDNRFDSWVGLPEEYDDTHGEKIQALEVNSQQLLGKQTIKLQE